MQTSPINRDHRVIILWLALCALLIAGMVLIGGYTRLSGSGLSITEWKPIHGTLPPMDDDEWQEEFAGYQQSPQYEQINRGMTLAQFQQIFWPEYIHRLLGRIIGAVFLLPLIFFTVRRSVPKPLFLRLAGIFLLGGLQGFVGWYMVKSGLIHDPQVSHLRLALHLSLAFAIYMLILWTVWDIQKPVSRLTNSYKNTIAYYRIWLVLLCVQIIFGAFMAGLHGGLIFNTYPTMNGHWFPDGLLALEPLWKNAIDNVITVQFIHRTLAALVVIYFAFWWYLARAYAKEYRMQKTILLVASALALQFLLGVATLLHQAPLPLAMAHQIVALLLFTAAFYLMHRMLKRKVIA